MSESKTSRRKVTGLERETLALELRKAGHTYLEIGEKLGFTQQAAHHAVMRALSKLSERAAENAEPVRRLELERLDRMFLVVWQMIQNGKVEAIDTALRIMARRARLMGLDAPEQSETTAVVHIDGFEQLVLKVWGGGAGKGGA